MLKPLEMQSSKHIELAKSAKEARRKAYFKKSKQEKMW